ncbi:MAG: hypothetical protein GVY02_08535, partial [Bacteroidetes bacterium]|nr:hypothetical protein [Bacteroidota bacterium]
MEKTIHINRQAIGLTGLLTALLIFTAAMILPGLAQAAQDETAILRQTSKAFSSVVKQAT